MKIEEVKTIKPATWIYNSDGVSSGELRRTIGAVEKALGFRLFAWQKTYIACGQFRQMGVTTAEILRDLLDVSGEPIDYSGRAKSEREKFYRRELHEIKTKLDNAGIPTRTVFFSERDKRAYREKEEQAVAYMQKHPYKESEMTIEEYRALAVAINSLRFNPDLSDIEVQSYEMTLANMRDRVQEGGKTSGV